MVHDQVGTSVYHPARRAQKPSLTSHIPQPAPTPGNPTSRQLFPTGVLGYTRTLCRGAVEALKTTISSRPMITRRKATPCGGSSPRRMGASKHRPTNLALARSSL